MTGGSKIVTLGGEEHADASEDVLQDADIELETYSSSEEDVEYFEDAETNPSPWKWRLIAFAAVAAIAAWTGFFGWTYQNEFNTSVAPARAIDLIVQWSVPVLLVGVFWLLALRNSTRESQRFAATAQLLSQESTELEQRLSSVNRELSLAREFLASQGRELESLGRVASERLSENAEQLQSLIGDNGQRIDSIASVSQTALENMGRLRDDLPVLANSARDVANQIGGAGNTAHAQLAELVAGFERLNEFGQASERQVTSLRGRVEETMASFEAQASRLEEIAGSRFAALRQGSEEFRGELDSREVEALAAIRQRAETLKEELEAESELLTAKETAALQCLGDRLSALRGSTVEIGDAIAANQDATLASWNGQIEAQKARLQEAIADISRIDEQALAQANEKLLALHEEAEALDARLAERDAGYRKAVAERRAELDKDEAQALEQLETRLANLDGKLSKRRKENLAAAEALTERGDELAGRLGGLREQIDELSAQGDLASKKLAAEVDALGTNLLQSREAISGTDTAISELTEGSIRLLELIKGAAEHSRETLPDALGDAEGTMSRLRSEVDQIGVLLVDASEKGKALSDYVIASGEDGKASAQAIETLHMRLARSGTEHAEKLHGLQVSIEKLSSASDAATEKVRTDLEGSIAQLKAAVEEATGALTERQSERIRTFSDELASKAAAATQEALAEKVENAIEQVEEIAQRATGASREAAVQLRDQLAKVSELAGNLETRVARAREQAEEQVDNDFARRVALITESLHSNAIDIDKALSADVSDTAWTAYLRGDRGIFTRRAVRLLESTDAREIAEVFDADDDFREHVSRYIHDFEAMLRTMLSTRDGNALGVTLLSSDMGKLYVALAQAIERLRD